MEISQYLIKMQKIEEIFIEFLDGVQNNENDSILFNFNYFEGLNYEDKKYRLKEILHLISQICSHHYRSADFYQKICTILIHFKDDIKQSYSNFEIFKIFSENKRILYFLLKEQILSFDQQFIDQFKNELDLFYFMPEIISIDKENSDNSEHFEFSREKGENESIICQIIRQDSVHKMVEFLNNENLSLAETKIHPSIFETNGFLIEKEPTLMEYAAFFGSIRIIQYLQMQKIKLTPSLWLYAIHGNSQEMIQYLEKNHIKPEDKSYGKCFEEAIKCHHNYIANYIQNNLMKKNRKIFPQIIPYYNYAFFQDDYQNYIHNFIENDYVELVTILLKNKNIDIKPKKIQNS